jgi:hypothetical protein
MKFIIILLNKFVPLKKNKFEAILKKVKVFSYKFQEITKKIPDNFEDIEKLNNIKMPVEKQKFDSFTRLFKNLDKVRDAIDNNFEKMIQIENTAVVENFLQLIQSLFETYRRESKIHFISQSISTLKKENIALVK